MVFDLLCVCVCGIRRDCLKLEGCTCNCACTNTYLSSRNCTCSPECLPSLTGYACAVLIGQSGPTQWQPTAHLNKTDPTPAGAVPGSTPVRPARPMDDAVPSPPRRSQLRTSTARCVGCQASTSGVPTVLCSDNNGIAACCRLPSQAHFTARRIPFLLLETILKACLFLGPHPRRLALPCVSVPLSWG